MATAPEPELCGDIYEGAEKVLYAFDFDHTIADKNSDVVVSEGNELPPSVESVYTSGNWTEYMNAVLNFLLEQGVPFNELINRVTSMPPTKGMIELLQMISKDPNATLVIVSDSNDQFISSFLSKYNINPSKVILITNKLVQNPLKLFPYENQTKCSICPKNLCKGDALVEFMKENGPFMKVNYVGDGSNDVCPALKLASGDRVFARINYPLYKAIQGKKVKGVDFTLLAQVYFWDDGTEIKKVLFS